MNESTRQAILDFNEAIGKIEKLVYMKFSGYTGKQLLTVWVVSQFEEPPSLSEVASMLGTSYQNVKEIVQKMVAKGDIELDKDPKDNRVTRIVLTDPKGELVALATGEIEFLAARIENTVSNDEVANFIQATNKLSKLINTLVEEHSE